MLLLLLVYRTLHNVARTLAVPPFYWRPCNCCVTAVASIPTLLAFLLLLELLLLPAFLLLLASLLMMVFLLLLAFLLLYDDLSLPHSPLY